MSLTAITSGTTRNKRWLFAGLIVAIVITLFFGLRMVRRFTHRPSNEPIREWMSLSYVAHSYRVPQKELRLALGLPEQNSPDRRTIKEIAKTLGKSSDEAIAILQEAIARARPTRAPPEDK